MKSIPDASSEIGLYRQGWNDAMRGEYRQHEGGIVPIAYAIGYSDAKSTKAER